MTGYRQDGRVYDKLQWALHCQCRPCSDAKEQIPPSALIQEGAAGEGGGRPSQAGAGPAALQVTRLLRPAPAHYLGRRARRSSSSGSSTGLSPRLPSPPTPPWRSTGKRLSKRLRPGEESGRTSDSVMRTRMRVRMRAGGLPRPGAGSLRGPVVHGGPRAASTQPSLCRVSVGPSGCSSRLRPGGPPALCAIPRFPDPALPPGAPSLPPASCTRAARAGHLRSPAPRFPPTPQLT